MKIIKSLLLLSFLMCADLNSKAVSFAVRNLSGAPIVGGVWKWGYQEYYDRKPRVYRSVDANIQGATPIASGELKGWSWDDQAPQCNRKPKEWGPMDDPCVDYSTMKIDNVQLIRQDKDPATGQLINIASQLGGDFRDNWDFALLPGGKIIQLRNYVGNYDATGRYMHPNFPTLYQGQIKEIVTVPKVILNDGSTIVGTVKGKQDPSIIYSQIEMRPPFLRTQDFSLRGALKQYIPGKIILGDGSALDWSQITNVQSPEQRMQQSPPKKGDSSVRPAPDEFLITLKNGTQKSTKIKQYNAGKIVMADGKEYAGELKQQNPAAIIMNDGKQYQNVKEVVPVSVVFTDGTVVLGDGTVTR